MNAFAAKARNVDWHRVQQVVKWVVYTLLLVNWVFYIFEDANRAFHTLTPESGFFKWTAEFATSIDEAAWFILLLMLELETYILGDDEWKGWVAKTVRGIRLLCFVMIAHTVVANTNAVQDYQPTTVWENVDHLCDIADQDVSYVYNLEYTEVTTETCNDLPTADQYYQVGDDPVISTFAGLELERDLAWADLVEVIVWILIIFAIEMVVRLQDRDITSGTLITLANRGKIVLYSILGVIAIYWGTLGHWLYTWDEFLWIAGFGAIELNVNEWREEILEHQAEEAGVEA
ncbi:MAG: hypothetical protein AAF431_09710 [Pseudomonadota bacterium]